MPEVDSGESTPPPAKRGSMEDPIQLEEKDSAHADAGRASSPGLSMAQMGRDGDGGVARPRSRSKLAATTPFALTVIIPTTTHEAWVPPLSFKSQGKCKGK